MRYKTRIWAERINLEGGEFPHLRVRAKRSPNARLNLMVGIRLSSMLWLAEGRDAAGLSNISITSDYLHVVVEEDRLGLFPLIGLKNPEVFGIPA